MQDNCYVDLGGKPLKVIHLKNTSHVSYCNVTDTILKLEDQKAFKLYMYRFAKIVSSICVLSTL